jgi:hypothetical protein
VYSDSRKVHATALCGLNEGFGWLKRVIHTVAPVPKGILYFKLPQNVFSVPSPTGDTGWSCQCGV